MNILKKIMTAMVALLFGVTFAFIVFYTGFPNSTGPLTFSGNIIGYMEGDYIYLESFGWGGSSGAGVFTANGKFIGYLLAVDVGETEEYGVDVLEDIVIIVPAFKIDWTTILK